MRAQYTSQKVCFLSCLSYSLKSSFLLQKSLQTQRFHEPLLQFDVTSKLAGVFYEKESKFDFPLQLSALNLGDSIVQLLSL